MSSIVTTPDYLIKSIICNVQLPRQRNYKSTPAVTRLGFGMPGITPTVNLRRNYSVCGLEALKVSSS